MYGELLWTVEYTEDHCMGLYSIGKTDTLSVSVVDCRVYCRGPEFGL